MGILLFKKIIDVVRRVPLSVWLIIIILMLSVYSCNEHTQRKYAEARSLQMEAALSEAMETIKNKNNELSAQKALLIGTEEDLKKLAEEKNGLGQEVSKLVLALEAEKTKKTKVKIITLVESQLVNPQITMQNEILKADAEGYTRLVFQYSDDFRELEGMSTFKITQPQVETKYHIIQDGDTYNKISVIYNVSPDKLRIRNYDNPDFKGVNTLNNDLLPVGKKMIISYTVKEASASSQYHTVKDDETLYSISVMYGLSVEDLKEMNNLTDNNINVNDTLVVGKINVEPGKTILTKDISRIDLAVALVEEDGIQKIRVTPKNPNVIINSLTGAIIEKPSLLPKPDSLLPKKPKRHSIGLQTGVGVGVYKNLLDSKIDIGIGFNIQVGYQYTLFSW